LRLIRHPDLLFCWSGKNLVVQNVESGARLVADPLVAALFDLFGRPLSIREAAKRAQGHDAGSVMDRIRGLRRARFLVPEASAGRRRSRLKAWNHNLASAFYHAATRDMPFPQTAATVRAYVRAHVTARPRPRIFKRYRVTSRSKLAPVALGGADLEMTLLARRTVREFSRRPVPFAELSRVLRGTWGWTGMFRGGLIEPLLAKTSPSGGGLHPGECYVLAWNVEGLAPGAYHYDIASDELRRLKRGDFRQQAVRAASGQKWVGQAAFLCVMTAVFARTLWKYRSENAYRTVWLDAGHLAQTFCLLATSRGLGPFTTAAIQDSFIEKLLGLDGIREFPVYLCGAGVPAPRSRRRIRGE
jgi:SagB-type dehydrogenase family enzyme